MLAFEYRAYTSSLVYGGGRECWQQLYGYNLSGPNSDHQCASSKLYACSRERRQRLHNDDLSSATHYDQCPRRDLYRIRCIGWQ